MKFNLIALCLSASMFTGSVAFSEKLTEKFKVTDVNIRCINCCSFSGLTDSCNYDAESDYRIGFLISKGFVSSVTLIAIITRLASGNYWDSAEIGLVQGRILLLSLTQLVQSHLLWHQEPTDAQPEGAVLILRGANDWNFAGKGVYTADLARYAVWMEDINYAADVEFAIQQVKERSGLPIKALIIFAHAKSQRIGLVNEGLTSQNIHRLRRAFELLDQDTPIVLVGCSAGNEMRLGARNIAMDLAQMAGGRKVWATADITTPFTSFDPETLLPNFVGLLDLVPIASWFWSPKELLQMTRCYRADPELRIHSCL